MTKIEELRAAFNATTGGEWRASQGCIYKGKTNISIAQCYVTTTNLNNDEVKNANFIALAHNNMPALLEAVEVLDYIIRGEGTDLGYQVLPDAVERGLKILEKLK